MDAVEYLKARERFYKAAGLDLDNFPRPCSEISTPEAAVAAVENWAKANPELTNAQKFEAVFGFWPRRDSCPGWRCKDSCGPRNCGECKKWWDQPYKEPEERT